MQLIRACSSEPCPRVVKTADPPACGGGGCFFDKNNHLFESLVSQSSNLQLGGEKQSKEQMNTWPELNAALVKDSKAECSLRTFQPRTSPDTFSNHDYGVQQSLETFRIPTRSLTLARMICTYRTLILPLTLCR